jgi:hypothetical protein
MKPITTFFLIFLLASFVSGIYFCATHQVHMVDFKEGFGEDLQGPTSLDCPDLLIKSGNSLLLYNSSQPEIPGVNPLPFFNLDEYINYLDGQRKKGIHCPVLFLQEENNTQGKSVFRVRPDIFQPQAGLPTQQQPIPIKVVDSSDDRAPWNQNQYQGFDPTGQFIGQYTTLDAIHDSTYKGKSLSENPMDENWGGVLYTKQAVDSGKYKDREVIPNPDTALFQEESDNIRNEKKASELDIFA